MPWAPEQYERFKRERELPFTDLLALVGPLREGARILDLGCGTGALTAQLADAYPSAFVLGIDTSPQMLEAAKPRERPQLRFVNAAIEAIDQIHFIQLGDPTHGEKAVDDLEWDCIFSNAALQWVPAHERLVQRIFARLAPGGRLGVQLPSNHDSVAHRVLEDVAAEAPYRITVRERPTLTALRYAEILWAEGGRDLVAYERVYPHELPDADAAVEWMKGTAMLPYLERLAPAAREAFTVRYAEALRAALPAAPLFFGFKRILFAASRR